jgi:Cu-Zn family superoxide dismutase
MIRHVGDLGNFRTDKNGRVRLELNDRLVSLYGKNNILNRALVIHQNQDDLGITNNANSTITGNSGGRIACGIVRKNLPNYASEQKVNIHRKYLSQLVRV